MMLTVEEHLARCHQGTAWMGALIKQLADRATQYADGYDDFSERVATEVKKLVE